MKLSTHRECTKRWPHPPHRMRVNGCRRFMALVVLLLSSTPFSSSGQDEGIVIGILPAPVYPANGNVDQRFPDQFVFFDRTTMDLILAYRTAPDTVRKVHRIQRPPQFTPNIVSTVSRKSLGGYRYHYGVANRQPSEQPILTWFLSTPAPTPHNPAIPVAHASKVKGQQRHWTQMVYGLRPGEWTVRFDGRSGAMLEPGRSVDFVVHNDNRPGIVAAYFKGVVSSIDPLPADVPPAAREQLERVLKLLQGWGEERRWTIGPKFGETVSSLEIASDYYSEILSLAFRGVLDRNSPYVETVLSTLEEFIERPRPWDEVEDYSPPIHEPFGAIPQSPDPQSSAELQLDLALKLALVFQR